MMVLVNVLFFLGFWQFSPEAPHFGFNIGTMCGVDY